MKILFLCHRFPYPPNRGGKIRPFNMIQHLSKRHEVIVGSLAHTEQEFAEGSPLKDYCKEVIAEIVPDSVRWAQAAAALFTLKPSSVAYFGSRRLRRRIEDAASRHTFDAVIVHCAFAAQYAVGIPAGFRLIDFGDLDSGKWFDYAKWRGVPLRYGYALEARKLRAYERKLAQSFDYCTLTTQGELEEFKKFQLARPHSVIPNGVDSEYFQPNGRKDKAAAIIVFVGRMDYFPNIDGALYFTSTILPIIHRSIPNAEFRIVGSNPTNEIHRLAKIPGIKVTGHVNDVRPYLTDAAVSVAPLRLARGTQNKILESMAMGLPVVATAQAAKGIQAVSPTHLLIGETPEAFATQVIEVIQRPSLREALSEAGRKRVAMAHDWASSMKLLDEVLVVGSAAERSACSNDWEGDSARSEQCSVQAKKVN
jgi:sugar transferase (PEP-CTERM/EpsH1 system associated)